VTVSLPTFCAGADRALSRAASVIRLLGAVAPRNGDAERARVIAAFEAGGEARPRWTYSPSEQVELARELDAISLGLEAIWIGEGEPLAGVYAARAAEMALEARLASAAGKPEFGALARRRFGARADEEDDEDAADALARAWIARPCAPPAGPLRTSDGPEPESLASRMRDAIGRARAPFVVEVRSGLASLAATGDRIVIVAAGRRLDDEDVRRTVLHEVDGHVLPRTRAAALSPSIFQLGTARGTDDQEGLALVLEERAGLLGPRRARELAARHLTTVAMNHDASFVECVRTLTREHGLSPREAVLVAERVYRGGDGERAGLGRERVYLAGYVRVRERLAAHPEDEEVLASGQVALEAVSVLRPLLNAPHGG
jgi:hypothetical protein